MWSSTSCRMHVLLIPVHEFLWQTDSEVCCSAEASSPTEQQTDCPCKIHCFVPKASSSPKRRFLALLFEGMALTSGDLVFYRPRRNRAGLLLGTRMRQQMRWQMRGQMTLRIPSITQSTFTKLVFQVMSGTGTFEYLWRILFAPRIQPRDHAMVGYYYFWCSLMAGNKFSVNHYKSRRFSLSLSLFDCWLFEDESRLVHALININQRQSGLLYWILTGARFIVLCWQISYWEYHSLTSWQVLDIISDAQSPHGGGASSKTYH